MLRGVADVSNESGRTTVRTGSEVFASAESRALAALWRQLGVERFIRTLGAGTDRRAAQRRVGDATCPRTFAMTRGVFDTYGSWGYESTYGGYVWYPHVAAGWRPYYYGNWSYYDHYGWTWHGYDRWSWADASLRSLGLQTAGAGTGCRTAGWGPAWVSWGYAPGYVSWCPLGYGGDAVFGFTPKRLLRRQHLRWRALRSVDRVDGRACASFVPRVTSARRRRAARGSPWTRSRRRCVLSSR